MLPTSKFSVKKYKFQFQIMDQGFVSLCANHGYVLNNVTVKETEASGRGLFTSGSFSLQEESDGGETNPILFVPWRNVITQSFVRNLSKLDRHKDFLTLLKSLEEVQPLSEFDILRLFILYLKIMGKTSDKNSPEMLWIAYESLLPSSFHTPLYYNECELKYFQGTALQHAVHAKLSYLQSRYDVFQHVTEKMQPFAVSFETFLWAESVIKSRMISIPETSGGVEQKDAIALIPLLDFCNHSFNPNAEVRFQEDGVYMYPKLGLAPSTEVFLCYGSEPNANLLFNHGFIDSQNPNPDPLVITPPPLIEYSIPITPEDPSWNAIQSFIFGKRTLFKMLNLSSVVKITPAPSIAPNDNATFHLLDDDSYLAMLLCVINVDDGFDCQIQQEHHFHDNCHHEHANDKAPYVIVQIGPRVIQDNIDKTHLMDAFKSHPLYDVLKLRIWHVLNDILEAQKQQMAQNLELVTIESSSSSGIKSNVSIYLNECMRGIDRTCARLDELKAESMKKDSVIQYLSSEES